MWSMTAMKLQKSNDEFRGLELNFYIFGQSVSMNRGLYYIRVHNLQYSQLQFRFKFVSWGRIEHDNNFECFFDIMLITNLLCMY
jgi:hypothetical protein